MRPILVHLISAKAKGFTLIELMLVVFIVGMMAAGVAMVSTQDRLPKQMTQETRALQATIRQLQNFSMTQKTMYGLSFFNGGWRSFMVDPQEDFLQWGHPSQQDQAEPVSRFTGIDQSSQTDDSSDEQHSPWTQVQQKKNAHSISKQLELQLFLDDEEVDILENIDTPQILFSSQGSVTPFVVVLRGVNTTFEVMLEVMSNGEVRRLDMEAAS